MKLRTKIVVGLFASILQLTDMLSTIAEEKVQSDSGSFMIPNEFTFRRTGTADSFKGAINRKSDGFVVHFDIGLMAGTHMNSNKQPSCSYYREHTINGVSARSGLQSNNSVRTIATTIYAAKSGSCPGKLLGDN
jgi:hypothetical protein